MGLYLCVFTGDDDDEVEGVEVGMYEDFGRFREAIARRLEGGTWGSRFPVLMMHSDCEGEWSVGELAVLDRELTTIRQEFAGLPPDPLPDGWPAEVGRQLGLKPASLLETFIDVDGEPLVDRLLAVVRAGEEHSQPVSFQ